MNFIDGKKNYGGLTILLVLLTPFLILPTQVRAEAQSGGMPGGWLSDYRGARVTGLGGAFVAVSDEPLGALWNPAGLSQLLRNQVFFETARYFEGTSVNGLSLAVPSNRLPDFGFTLLSLRSGEFERTNQFNEHLGTFREGDLAILMSASKRLIPWITLGANIKVAHQSIAEFSGTGAGVDFGVMLDLTPRLRVGASLLNLGGPALELRDRKEQFPSEFRGGFSVSILGGRGLVAAEIDHSSGFETTFHGGGELSVYRNMTLRFGMNQLNPAGGFTFDVDQLELSYGMQDSQLGMMHYFSVSYRFGGFYAASSAKPEVFSPLGNRPVTNFSLESRMKSTARKWSFSLIDNLNRVVKSYGGPGDPPASLVWDGRSNSGKPLPDGKYRYRLVVTDEEGCEMPGKGGVVEIDTDRPGSELPVVIEP
jgi:hypothetical protein